MGGPGSGQQLPLEEVTLRVSVDFFMEMTSFQQQLGDSDHPCLCLFNLHHINTLLERSLISSASISTRKQSDSSPRAPAAEGTTLVMLGKAHQSWLSELQSVFLSNCPAEAPAPSTHGGPKYFSVAIRSSNDTNLPISVEALHCLVQLAEHHVHAPLLQPRLMQLHGLLNEYITAASGVSRRASEQARA
ncbi:hypothetical protein PHYSODRAFT_497346, partial [Phytophthora sojae]